MTGAVAAEEDLLKKVVTLAEHEGVSIGLIIGQVTSQKTFVLHLAPTPEQSRDTSLENIKDIDMTRLGEHARYITRMLPGGLWVLGVFIVNHDELFKSHNISVLKKILSAVDVSVTEGFCLYGRNPSGASLVFHYNGSTKEYRSQTFDKNLSEGFKHVDWKFQSTSSNWCEINSYYYIQELHFESNTSESFRKQLENLLDRVLKDVESLNILLENKEWEHSKSLESVLKTATDKQNCLSATLLRPAKKNPSAEMRMMESSMQLQVAGCLPSRIFLHPRATVAEGCRAVRQDIIRSLAARLEMHWDSLVDEEDGSPEERERVHEPPRRVLLRPKGWLIYLTDFLFPGENKEQTVRSCKELLDLDIPDEDVIDNFEVPADAVTMMSSMLPEVEAERNIKNMIIPFPKIFLAAGVVLLFTIILNYFIG